MSDFDKILVRHLAGDDLSDLIEEQRELIRELREQTRRVYGLAVGGRVRGHKFLMEVDDGSNNNKQS